MIYSIASRQEPNACVPEGTAATRRHRALHVSMGAPHSLPRGLDVVGRTASGPGSGCTGRRSSWTFPFAFTLNRLGQHYAIDPTDPAKWSTLRGGALVLGPDLRVLELSPGAPLPGRRAPATTCPALQRRAPALLQKIGWRSMGYGEILREWIVRNRVPHTNWFEGPAEAEAVKKVS